MIRKALSSVLSVVMLSQVVFASRPEQEFWAERHITAQKQSNLQNSVQMASLGVPPVRKSEDQTISALIDHGPITKPALGSSPLREITGFVSPTCGTVQEVFAGDEKQAPVVILQDVHVNAEAQQNLSVILQALIDRAQIASVNVEGAFDRFNFTPFRTFPDTVIRNRVSKSYLDAAKMAAPSYVGITSVKEPPPFIGVDDQTSYWANVQAYLDSRKLKTSARDNITTLTQKVQSQKRAIFSRELQKFDAARSAYHAGNLALSAYADTLMTIVGSQHIPTVLQEFHEASQIEKNLNFSEVDRQRKRVFETLLSKLTEPETQQLVADSMAYREGKIGFGDYHRIVKSLCVRHGINLQQTPLFNAYVHYLLLTDAIKATQLFESLDVVERRASETLMVTSEQKRLSDLSESLILAAKLIEFDLTNKEWRRYRELPRPFAELETFEGFYTNADIRSDKIAATLLQTTSSTPVVLVVGGFHTSAIADKLRALQKGYLIISPKVTKVSDAPNAYLSIFEQQKTPLTHLFRAPKLFINPTVENITDPNLARPVFNEMNEDLSVSVGGHILWLRALLFRMGMNVPQYKKTYLWIENIAAIILGTVVAGIVTTLLGMPLSTFWTHPTMLFAFSSVMGWLLFIVAHWPELNKTALTSDEDEQLIELNFAYASHIAVMNMVVSVIPLIVASLFPNVPIEIYYALMTAALFSTVPIHRRANIRAARLHKLIAEQKVAIEAPEQVNKSTLSLLYKFLGQKRMRAVHAELWFASPTYRALFAGEKTNLKEVKQVWGKLFDSADSVYQANANFELEVGQKIGKFTVIDLLSRGGFGVVYRARDDLGNPVILKMIRLEPTSDLKRVIVNIASLMNEADNLRLLEQTPSSHLIAPKVLASGFAPGQRHYLLATTEIPGKSLDQLFGDNQNIDVTSRDKAHRILSPTNIANLYDLIAEAHRRGVVHGDLKPGNIIVTNPDVANHDDWKFALIDFGAAKPAHNTDHVFVDHMGTEHYSSPNKWRTKSSPREDIYSIGEFALHHLPSELTRTESVFNLISEGNNLNTPDVTAAEMSKKWRELAKNLTQGRLSRLSNVFWDMGHVIASVQGTDKDLLELEQDVFSLPEAEYDHYAALKEWAFHIPLAIGLLSGFGILHLLAVAAVSSALFAVMHRTTTGVEPNLILDQLKLWTVHFVIFTGMFILPWTVFVHTPYFAVGIGTLLSMLTHIGYNELVVWLQDNTYSSRLVDIGFALPFASIQSSRKKMRSSPSSLPELFDTIFETVPTQDILDIHKELKKYSPSYAALVNLDKKPESTTYIRGLWQLIFDAGDSITSGAKNQWNQSASVNGIRLKGRLGMGGFGIVFEAENHEHRPMAIKMTNFTDDDDTALPLKSIILSMLALRSEGKMLRSITQNKSLKGIAPALFDMGVIKPGYKMSERFYLSMEKLSGDPLSKFGVDRLNNQDIVRLFQMLARLHRHGIIHGDIKPSNIMVLTKPDGSHDFRFLDFGSSKKMEEAVRVTDYFLSPTYASSERILSGSTAETDVFALATIIMKSRFRNVLSHTPTIKLLELATTQIPIGATEIPIRPPASRIARSLQKSLKDMVIDTEQTTAPVVYRGKTITAAANSDAPTGEWQPALGVLPPGVLLYPKGVHQSTLLLALWETITSPLWEEALFTGLALIVGQPWVFVAGRMLFVALHVFLGKPKSVWGPLAISTFIGMIVGSQTGWDFSNLSTPALLRIYAGAVSAHISANGFVTMTRNQQYRRMAQTLISEVLNPDRTNTSNLLDQLTADTPPSIDQLFASRANRISSFVRATSFDDKTFWLFLNEELKKKILKTSLSPVQIASLVQRMALLGVPAEHLSDLSRTTLEGVNHIHLLIEGSNVSLDQDVDKIEAVRHLASLSQRPIDIRILVGNPVGLAALKDRFKASNLLFSLRPDNAISNDGVLWIDRLTAPDRLASSMFFVSIQSVVRIDVSEDQGQLNALEREELLRSLKVAFLDELLRVRVLSGLSLSHLDTVARAIAAAA